MVLPRYSASLGADVARLVKSPGSALAGEFFAVMSKWLALDVVLPEDRSKRSKGVNDVEPNDSREGAIEKQFKDTFGGDVEKLQDRKKDAGLREQLRETVTFDKAWGTWNEVREQVKGAMAGLYANEVDIETSEDASSYLGVSGGDIQLNPTLSTGLKVSADVYASFDGFWMLAHELLHIQLGLDDAVKHKFEGGRDVTKQVDNSNTHSVQRLNQRGLGAAGSRLMGEVVSKLEVLRVGFGLPLRTPYTDEQGSILFSREGAIGDAESARFTQNKDSRRLEFVGAIHGKGGGNHLASEVYTAVWLRTLDRQTIETWTASALGKAKMACSSSNGRWVRGLKAATVLKTVPKVSWRDISRCRNRRNPARCAA